MEHLQEFSCNSGFSGSTQLSIRSFVIPRTCVHGKIIGQCAGQSLKVKALNKEMCVLPMLSDELNLNIYKYKTCWNLILAI